MITEEKKKEVIEILDASLSVILDQKFMQMDQARKYVDAFRVARMAVKNMDDKGLKHFSIRSVSEKKLSNEIEALEETLKRKWRDVTIFMSEETANDIPYIRRNTLSYKGERIGFPGAFEGYDVIIDNDLEYGEVELR